MVIGLSGILIFFVGLGLSYIPDIGVVASYVLRVTAILAIVGLYELVVRACGAWGHFSPLFGGRARLRWVLW